MRRVPSSNERTTFSLESRAPCTNSATSLRLSSSRLSCSAEILRPSLPSHCQRQGKLSPNCKLHTCATFLQICYRVLVTLLKARLRALLVSLCRQRRRTRTRRTCSRGSPRDHYYPPASPPLLLHLPLPQLLRLRPMTFHASCVCPA